MPLNETTSGKFSEKVGRKCLQNATGRLARKSLEDFTCYISESKAIVGKHCEKIGWNFPKNLTSSRKAVLYKVQLKTSRNNYHEPYLEGSRKISWEDKRKTSFCDKHLETIVGKSLCKVTAKLCDIVADNVFISVNIFLYCFVSILVQICDFLIFTTQPKKQHN